MVSKFRKSANNFSTTLASGIGSTDTVMSLASVSTLPTDTEVDFVIDRVNASGTRTPSAREYVKGTVSGTTITSMTRGLGGSSALTHTSGAVIEAVVNSQTQNDLVDGLGVSLNQDGTLKAGAVSLSTMIADNTVVTSKIVDANVTTAKLAASAVTTATIADANVTTTKIADNNVTASKLATNAILQGSASITGTTNSGSVLASPTQIPGASVTFTNPSGGRTLEVSFYAGDVSHGGGNILSVSLWDGTVGTGTQLAKEVLKATDNSYGTPIFVRALVTPAAGSKTYNVGWTQSAATAQINATTTNPAQLVVKAI